jgi:hypothetical protein
VAEEEEGSLRTVGLHRVIIIVLMLREDPVISTALQEEAVATVGAPMEVSAAVDKVE